MALSSPMAAAVTPVELIAVLAWCFLLLAGAAMLARRLYRRGRSAARRLLRRLDQAWFWSRMEPPAAEAEQLPTDCPAQRAAGLSGQQSMLPVATLELLCRYVDFRRRLEVASAELVARLSRLPGERWRIEPYPLTGERGNTLLVLGETGVFVISATYAPGHWDDVLTVHKLAEKIELLLPGYRGAVQPALCHPFTTAAPRMWHRPDDEGNWIAAWVLGGEHVIEWLYHFGREHGLSRGDLERFDRLAKPNWLQAAIPSLPSWPPVSKSTPPGAAG